MVQKREWYTEEEIARDENELKDIVEDVWKRFYPQHLPEILNMRVWTDFDNENRHIYVSCIDDGMDYLYRLVSKCDPLLIQYASLSFTFLRDTENGLIEIDFIFH